MHCSYYSVLLGHTAKYGIFGEKKAVAGFNKMKTTNPLLFKAGENEIPIVKKLYQVSYFFLFS